MYIYSARVTKIVDGDTIDAEVDLGFTVVVRIRFRLHGIDAPETFGVKRESAEYRKGLRAKKWLDKKIGGKLVHLKSENRGKFGRWIATVWTDGAWRDWRRSVNAEMVRRGLAKRKKYR